MQARTVATNEAALALGDASDRILAVATTHDQLWRQDQSEAVDLAELLPQLCRQLDAQSPTVTVHSEIAPFEVVPNKATSIALLVTEVVTNAFKHAFDDQAGGEVRVQLSCVSGEAWLTVRNNGRGLPEGFDPNGAISASLGMRLIKTLGSSFGSTVEIASENGTQVIVRGIAGSGHD